MSVISHSCFNKIQYHSAFSAHKALSKMNGRKGFNRRYGHDLIVEVYKCPVCYCYHVGHKAKVETKGDDNA